MQTYIVKKGDTLYGISKQFGVSVENIKKLNNLTNDTLTINQQLQIPLPNTTITYIVKQGDNLYKIANKYNTTVTKLIELNNLKTPILSIGQKLQIPVETSSDENSSNYIIYTVKQGDNLYSIANQYNQTVEAIKELNNLESNLLSIGQILKIPKQNYPINYYEYEVKPGDSLYSIAKKYNTTVDELIAINKLTTSILSVGQILRIKIGDSEIDSAVKECYGTGYSLPEYETYVVKKGDNLYSIAKKYNLSVIDLMKLNNLDTTNLEIGQILKVRRL